MLRQILLVAASCLLACGDRTGEPEAAHAPAAPPDIAIDSALPIDTLLRRFQSGLQRPPGLLDASSSRAALVTRYLDALGRSDTNALRRLHISRAEYAFLYFPSSKMMKPPYELPPEVAWLLLSAESGKGITAVLRRFGGQRLQFDSVRCPGEPLRESPSVVWRDCVVRYRGEGGAVREDPLFAAIIERGGRFKFFSYATPL